MNKKKGTSLLTIAAFVVFLVLYATGVLGGDRNEAPVPTPHNTVSEAGNLTAPAPELEFSAQPQSDVVEYEFRTQEQFDDHYEKHGAEFGDITQEEYLRGARELIASDSALTKTESDGDSLFYDEQANEFAVLSSDGYIRTFFRPDDGIDYWNRQ